MNRYTFTDILELKHHRHSCLVNFSNWSDVCSFISRPVFKTGIYTNRDPSSDPSGSCQNMGVILNGPNGDILVREGEYIYWQSGIYEVEQNGEYIKIYE